MPFPVSDHCDGSKFFNPNGIAPKGLRDVIRWQLTSHRAPWPPSLPVQLQPKPADRVTSGPPRITLIGHSTVLIQAGNLNILTDPIWSERASPVQWAGPRRRRAPALAITDVPPIDVILLSHNHYDHLDRITLTHLIDRHHPRIITTLGVARSIPGSKATELDWWQTNQVQADALLTCVPAIHFSARTPFDRNQTLWCGFYLKTPEGTIYFAGDTAWGDHFQQIRVRLGPPDIALLPIGAYLPRWFMSAVHMDPEAALRAHEVLGAKKSFAIHHGTFPLADDGPDEAVTELTRELERKPVAHPFVAF